MFVGEFTGGALVAGLQGVPTIYLSGDDKAASEAKVFIPEIETTIVKRGTGRESAIHLDQGAACAMIRRDSARAVQRIGEIPPFTGIRPPYTLEIRRVEPLGDKLLPGAKRIDDRAFILEAESALDFKLL
jgi:D-amino peptidase